jgi:hypothetical protein
MNDIYTYTVPLFIKQLGGLKNVLLKAKDDIAAGKLDEKKLMEDRLAPDMFPFPKQVQVATDQAKGVVGRLTTVPAPKYEDTESTLDELIARIDKTMAFLSTVKESDFANAPSATVELPYFPGKKMGGFGYAREYVLPNFFFHISMAYALVRKNDVAIGKADYINGLPFIEE